jgi:HNH endonuclease
VLVSRHRTDHPAGTDDHLAARLQAAARRLPPTLGGAPTQPLELGRTSRVVSAGQRVALMVRDRGCGVAGCGRPPPWCEAHHLVHWLHGGPTDLANLALVCRAHHRAVHEGGWRLTRHPDGRLAATPPHRKQRAAA